ncbi:MAG: methyltransferase domain-containing protein [Mesorhizobium sp.]
MEPIVDADLSLRRKLRALARPTPGADFLLKRTIEDMADRLDAVSRRFPDTALILTPPGDIASVLLMSGKVDRLVELVSDPALASTSSPLIPSGEALPLAPQSLDLAVSLMGLHEVADLPGVLVQIRQALRPDGLFIAGFPGAGTLAELRESLLAAETELTGGASPRVLPFADVRDAGALLQRAGFALPVADLETVTVRYGSMFVLMRDLRAMGATSALVARSRRPATRLLFMRAAEIYAERFSDADGRIRATFSTIWMSGWRPDASQQQPARRGSATMSLSDALKDDDAK